MNYYLIQGEYIYSTAPWFQIVLAPSLEEAKGLALLQEAKLDFGSKNCVYIDPEGDNPINELEIPENYNKDFLIQISSYTEYFRFYPQDAEDIIINSSIELNKPLEEINVKEFLEIYLNRVIKK